MKTLKLILFSALVLNLTGCEGCRKDIRHMKSSAVGLKRRVTYYNMVGDPIKIWEGTFKTEVNSSGTLSFIDKENHEIKVPAQFTLVEEID